MMMLSMAVTCNALAAWTYWRAMKSSTDAEIVAWLCLAAIASIGAAAFAVFA